MQSEYELRELAARARLVGSSLTLERDQQAAARYADELEMEADRLLYEPRVAARR